MKSPGEWRTDAESTWCPGCGNHKVLESLQRVLAASGWLHHDVCLVGGIGQAAKTVQYVNANYLHGLHGRALPAAIGVKLANPKLRVIAVGGDGDMYGEGGNHLVNAVRRNVGVTCLVHNNGVYGLTKGQSAPTAGFGFVTRAQPTGTTLPAFNPIAAAIAAGATFVARGFAGDQGRLERLMAQALKHPGFALLDILQPCVSYNPINTYQWFGERVYDLAESGHDNSDVRAALARALEWPGQDERVPCGVFLAGDRPSYEGSLPPLGDRAPVERVFDPAAVDRIIEEFR
jgi:2-oxoglutarate ferredoxin oxidoreductase subunit beta